MKSFFFAILLATAVSTSSFAADPKVSPMVLRAFNKTFVSAREVGWTVTHNLYKAQFNMNGQVVTAFYQADGSMIAVSRNITSIQLPVTLQVDLKIDYKEFWISDLFEVSDDNGTDYYVTLESADEKVILKSFGNSSWTRFKKLSKS